MHDRVPYSVIARTYLPTGAQAKLLKVKKVLIAPVEALARSIFSGGFAIGGLPAAFPPPSYLSMTLKRHLSARTFGRNGTVWSIAVNIR